MTDFVIKADTTSPVRAGTMNVDGDQNLEGEQAEQRDLLEGEQGGFGFAAAADPENELTATIWRGDPLEVVRSLVESRPHLLRSIDGVGYTALHHAVESGSPIDVLECIYAGCTYAISARTGQHQILPVHCVGPRTPPECVGFLLDRHPRSIKFRTALGDLPVHCAIFKGTQRDAVRVLVERYPRCVDELNAEGFLPIHAIAATPGPNQLEVTRYLLEVSPQSVRARTIVPWGGQMSYGELPLHLVLQIGAVVQDDPHGVHGGPDPLVVGLLLEHWPESAREPARSCLPLHFALSSSAPSAEAVRRLLAAYPEALRQTAPDGSTVLHEAARNINSPPNLFRLLLMGWPGLIMEADAAGDLPVHAALRCPEVPLETLELLGRAYPPGLRAANSRGQRPVHVATARDCPAAVRIVASLSRDSLRDVGPNGNTPAHLAAACDYASADLAVLVAGAWPESLLALNHAGDTPTHVAIDRAHPSMDAVEVFVGNCPASVHVANSSGTRPLFVAIARGHATIARLLVEQVPESARQVDADGNPPLFLAAENVHMDLNVVFLLLKAWPEVVLGTMNRDFRSQWLSRVTSGWKFPSEAQLTITAYGYPSTSLTSIPRNSKDAMDQDLEEEQDILVQGDQIDDPDRELTDAIRRGEALEVVRSIVERRPHLVREAGGRGSCWLPLHAAVASGSPLELLAFVHGRYPDAIRTGSDWKHSLPMHSLPLHCVGLETPPECVLFLLERYPEAIATRNDRGELPLHTALAEGASRSVVQVLVERLPPSIAERDALGRKAVHSAAAAYYGPHRLDVIRYLVELAPESVRERATVDGENSPPGRGELPLHLALEAGEVDPGVIRFLLEQFPDSVREMSDSWLPLQLALISRGPSSEEVVQIVLDAYPEALRDSESRGSTMLAWAVKDGAVRSNHIRLLVDAYPEALLTADSLGDLPIHSALREGWPCLDTLGLLADRCPQSVRAFNGQGARPVHLAVAQKNVQAVHMLAARFPEVLRDVDEDGNTPAHTAAACPNVPADLVRYVAGAWPESLLAQNKYGFTPTHVAISRSSNSCTTETVEFFIERCPESLRVANAQGNRPLALAIALGRREVARLVVKKDPESVRHVDARGWTALHFAASRETLLPDTALLRLLAESWPDALQIRDAEGNLPLVLAAENRSVDLSAVFFLFRAWPDVVLGTRLSSTSSGGAVLRRKRPRSDSMTSPRP